MTNLIKAAAVTAALTLAGTAAMAENSFGLQHGVDGDSAVTIDMVTSDTAGVVGIYDYTGGEFGALLGMAEVNAGANPDLNIVLDNNIASEMAAVLYNGELTEPANSAAWIELEVEDS